MTSLYYKSRQPGLADLEEFLADELIYIETGLKRLSEDVGRGTVDLVRDYGAAANGTTDDAAKLQAAIDSLTTGGTILIKGTVAIGSAGWTGITIANPDVSIISTSRREGFKVLALPSQTPSDSAQPAVFKVTANRFRLSSALLDANNIAAIPLVLDGSQHSVIDGNHIKDTNDASSHGIYATGGVRNTVDNNFVEYCGVGLRIGGGTSGSIEVNPLIRNNQCIANTNIGIFLYTDGGACSGNICKSNGHSGIWIKAAGPGSGGSQSVKTAITGNVCDQNTLYGIATAADVGTDYVNWISIVGNQCNTNVVGIVITKARNVICSANMCSNNTSGGINVASDATLITCTGNTCEGTTYDLVFEATDSQEQDNLYDVRSGTKFVTLPLNNTTPSVKNAKFFGCENSSPTTITMFDDGVPGQEIVMFFGNSNTTIDFTSSTLRGNGGVAYNPSNDDSMRCVFDGTNWWCSVT